MINDNHYPIRNNNNNSIAIIDESHEPRPGNLYLIHRKRKVEILSLDDDDDDEILNILIRKRDELVIAFR